MRKCWVGRAKVVRYVRLYEQIKTKKRSKIKKIRHEFDPFSATGSHQPLSWSQGSSRDYFIPFAHFFVLWTLLFTYWQPIINDWLSKKWWWASWSSQEYKTDNIDPVRFIRSVMYSRCRTFSRVYSMGNGWTEQCGKIVLFWCFIRKVGLGGRVFECAVGWRRYNRHVSFSMLQIWTDWPPNWTNSDSKIGINWLKLAIMG